MSVTVSTPIFEGPVDVLFQLVSDQKVDIYEVPIAVIVDGFLSELEERSALGLAGLADITEFLVIVAILIELKSRRLLPGPDRVDDDEELGGYEQRDRLLARLLELQAYSAAADAFAMMIELSARSVPRTAGLEEQFRDLAPDMLAGVTPTKLAAAYLRATEPKPETPEVDLSHVTVEPVTVAEAVEELLTQLPGNGTMSFRFLTAHCTSRMQIIVRFLALLELCKQGLVDLDQGETFGSLSVTWLENDDSEDRPVMAGSLPLAIGASVVVEEYDG